MINKSKKPKMLPKYKDQLAAFLMNLYKKDNPSEIFKNILKNKKKTI